MWLGDLFSNVVQGASGALGGLPFDLYGAGAADRANRRAMQKQYDLGVQFDSTAIQRRVQDAEKAGVHPLFALGASPAQGPSLSVVPSEKGEAFRSVSRSIANKMSPMDKALQMAQLKVLEAQASKDFAMAQSYSSEYAMNGQRTNTTGAAPVGAVDVIPKQITSRSPHQMYLSAGVDPAMQEVQVPSGGTRFVPSKAMAEIYEALGEILGPLQAGYDMVQATINRRAEKYFGNKLYKKNKMPREEFERLYYGWPYKNEKRR